MKIKKISFFLFFIIFSSLLSSEITYLSSKTFQDENAIQISSMIGLSIEMEKSPDGVPGEVEASQKAYEIDHLE